MVEMLNRMMGLVTVLVTGSMMTACGGDSLGDRVDLVLDPVAGTASMKVEMSDNLEVALAGEFPIGGNGYATIEFVPGSRTERASILLKVDLLRIVEDQVDIGDLGVGVVNNLPNGAPFPAAILPPLASIPVVQSGSVRVNAMLGLIPELQVGAMIHIDQFRSGRFPQGVSICQNFRNSDNVAFAAICLVGPGNNTSGGIFVGGNFGEVLDFDLPVPFSQPEPQLMAMSRMSALSAAPADDLKPQMTIVSDELVESSYFWTEQSHKRRQMTRTHRNRALDILRRR